MDATLDDLSFRHHEDLIRVADRIQPVGDDQQRLALAQLADSLLDITLVVRVHAGCGLVQNDNGGVLQDTPGDGNSLFLAAGEGFTALADYRIVAVRQAHNEVVAAGFPGRLYDLLPAGVRAAHADVVVDGVLDVELSGLLQGDSEHLEIFLISRLPRLLAILCTGIGMSVAGLIMQQLCMNKFVSPTTGATISSAQFGILLALLFLPNSTLWGRAVFSFVFAVLGTWIFVCFIQRIQFKDVVMVPLAGIMFGNVIGGITNYLAYKYEMTQALSAWLVGHFSMVLRGRYEIVWLTVPLVVLAFLFANHFNIVGMGKDFSQNLGVPYNFVLFLGLTIAAMITASVVVVVGSISYIGLIVPNLVAMFKGDKIRGTLIDTALFGALFVLECDMAGRMVIFPCTLCTAHRHSFILFLFQHPEYPYPRDGPQ